MANTADVINQAIADFDTIKEAIEQSGVEVPYDTDTSEYGNKIREIAANGEKAYEAGKQAEYDAFWDEFQNYGNRTNYNYCFASECWNDNTFKPKYDINLKGYCPYFGADMAVTDMSKILTECGVVLNTSNATNFDYMFYIADVTKLPALDFSNATSLNYCIYFCNSLKEIEKIIVTEKQTFPNSLIRSANIETVIFEGVIASTLTLPTLINLSVDSMISIIGCLAHYNGTDKEFAYTLTLAEDCWTRLEASGRTPQSEFGWDGSDTWKDYCFYIGWNT